MLRKPRISELLDAGLIVVYATTVDPGVARRVAVQMSRRSQNRDRERDWARSRIA
jgi:hypothetical protein